MGRPIRHRLGSIGAQPLNDNKSDEQKVPHYSFLLLIKSREKSRRILCFCGKGSKFRWCRIQTMNGIYAFAARVPWNLCLRGKGSVRVGFND